MPPGSWHNIPASLPSATQRVFHRANMPHGLVWIGFCSCQVHVLTGDVTVDLVGQSTSDGHVRRQLAANLHFAGQDTAEQDTGYDYKPKKNSVGEHLLELATVGSATDLQMAGPPGEPWLLQATSDSQAEALARLHRCPNWREWGQRGGRREGRKEVEAEVGGGGECVL